MVRRSSARRTRMPGMSRRTMLQGAGGLSLATYLGTRATGTSADGPMAKNAATTAAAPTTARPTATSASPG